MTSLGKQLIYAAEREDIGLDDEPKPGECIRFSACVCDDGRHGYPDRDGWRKAKSDAYTDVLDMARQDAHLIRRTVAVVR